MMSNADGRQRRTDGEVIESCRELLCRELFFFKELG